LLFGGVLTLLFAAAAGWPGAAWAAEPVETLREALKIQITGVKPDLKLAKKRLDKIDEAIKQLKETSSIGELRRAYFLKEWEPHFLLPQPLPVLPKHAEIGDLLKGAIEKAAADPKDPTRPNHPTVLLALCIQIAEMADSEETAEMTKRQKFTRRLDKVILSLARRDKVAKTPQMLTVRQAALHALGKITPDPIVAFEVLQETLQNDPEIGPRRLAAYAVSDLAKNSRLLGRKDILKTIELAVGAAAVGLKDQDEAVRGYSLQGIAEAAKAFKDFVGFPLEPLVDEGKKAVLDDVKSVLKTFQAANPRIVAALADKERINVRLAAVQTLDQIGQARLNLVLNLDAENRDKPGKVLDDYSAPDPFENVLPRDAKKAGDWQAFTQLLYDSDVRLRRGGIDLLELLRDGATPAAGHMATALRDADLFVRWSAARTVRNIDPKNVDAGAISALNQLLKDRDSNLSKAAAEAIEKLGPVAAGSVDTLGEIIANTGADNGSWDVESRVAAMKALAAIGKPAYRVLPRLVEVMTDADVRVRREAAYTIGRFGTIDEPSLEKTALAALTKALGDEDAEVRQNASEAILNIAAKR